MLQIVFATRAVLKIGEYLTIRLLALVFYEQIVNEAQPSGGFRGYWPDRGLVFKCVTCSYLGIILAFISIQFSTANIIWLF